MITGDIDGDGEVSFSDVGSMYLLLLNGGEMPDELIAAADVDGDGQVTFADVAALYLRLLG